MRFSSACAAVSRQSPSSYVGVTLMLAISRPTHRAAEEDRAPGERGKRTLDEKRERQQAPSAEKHFQKQNDPAGQPGGCA